MPLEDQNLEEITITDCSLVILPDYISAKLRHLKVLQSKI